MIVLSSCKKNAPFSNECFCFILFISDFFSFNAVASSFPMLESQVIEEEPA